MLIDLDIQCLWENRRWAGRCQRFRGKICEEMVVSHSLCYLCIKSVVIAVFSLLNCVISPESDAPRSLEYSVWKMLATTVPGTTKSKYNASFHHFWSPNSADPFLNCSTSVEYRAKIPPPLAPSRIFDKGGGYFCAVTIRSLILTDFCCFLPWYMPLNAKIFWPPKAARPQNIPNLRSGGSEISWQGGVFLHGIPLIGLIYSGF